MKLHNLKGAVVPNSLRVWGDLDPDLEKTEAEVREQVMKQPTFCYFVCALFCIYSSLNVNLFFISILFIQNAHFDYIWLCIIIQAGIVSWYFDFQVALHYYTCKLPGAKLDTVLPRSGLRWLFPFHLWCLPNCSLPYCHLMTDNLSFLSSLFSLVIIHYNLYFRINSFLHISKTFLNLMPFLEITLGLELLKNVGKFICVLYAPKCL